MGWSREASRPAADYLTACMPGRAQICPAGHWKAHQSMRLPSGSCSSKAREPCWALPQSGQWWIPVMNVAMQRPYKLPLTIGWRDPAVSRGRTVGVRLVTPAPWGAVAAGAEGRRGDHGLPDGVAFSRFDVVSVCTTGLQANLAPRPLTGRVKSRCAVLGPAWAPHLARASGARRLAAPGPTGPIDVGRACARHTPRGVRVVPGSHHTQAQSPRLVPAY